MANIDLGTALKGIGEQIVADVKEAAKSEMLPPELKVQALKWAAGSALALLDAGSAKAAGNQVQFDRCMREVKLYGDAAKAVATGELLIGIAVAEQEARKALSMAINTGLNIGVKLLGLAIL